MERSLHKIVVLGTMFFYSVFCQITSPQGASECISTRASLEFNSIKFGEFEYTKQNVRSICSSASSWTTLDEVDNLVACASEAFDTGMNSFSFKNGVCEVSSFYVTPNSTDVLQRVPSDGADAVFIAFPPVDEESASFDQEEGFPSLEIMSSEITSGRPLGISVSAAVWGRMCLISSLKWEGNGPRLYAAESEMIKWNSERTFSFTIESANSICSFGDIVLIFAFENELRSLTEVTTNVRSPNNDLNDLSVAVNYEWLNLDTNPNGAELHLTVTHESGILTAMTFATDYTELGAVDDIGNRTTFEFTYTLPAIPGDVYYEGNIYASFYGEHDCKVLDSVLFQRSVCTSEYEAEDGEVKIIFEVGDSFSMCTIHHIDYTHQIENFEDVQEYCSGRKLRDELTFFTLIKVDDDKSTVIVKNTLRTDKCPSVWSSYRLSNGVWQWEDGSTEINETLIDISGFSRSEGGGECTQFKFPDVDGDRIIMEQIDCAEPPPCTVCSAPLLGNVTDAQNFVDIRLAAWK